MGYYCTVPQCTSLAGKTKNVKFHRFPRDVTMADRWNVILKRGKPYTKYSKVCSLHFTQSDYNVTTMGKKTGQWKTLSKDAVPSQNLPKLNPDGTVMVIRKSRTVKYRESSVKKEIDGLGDKPQDKWPQASSILQSVLAPSHSPQHIHVNMTPGTAQRAEESNLAYRLQTINALANSLTNPGHSQSAPPKPKKQDATMQTDPVSEEDDNQHNSSFSDHSDSSFHSEHNSSYPLAAGFQKDEFDGQVNRSSQAGQSQGRDSHPTHNLAPQQRDGQTSQNSCLRDNYEIPKDYTKNNEDFNHTLPETDKYGLDRKSGESNYQKQVDGNYQKQVDGNYQKQLDGNYQKQVESNYPKTVDSNYSKTVESNYQKQVDGNYQKQTESNYQKTVESNYQKQTESNYQKQVDGNYQKQTESNYQKHAESNYQKQVDSNYQKQAESNYQKQAESNYQKTVENSYHQKIQYNKVQDMYPGDYNRDFQEKPAEYNGRTEGYNGYQNGYHADSVDILRNQQHNIQMLQEQHRVNENQNFFNENHIKQEIDLSNEEDKYLYEQGKEMESSMYDQQRRQLMLQQRMLEQLQPQVKTEPDPLSGCDPSLPPSESPYYQNGQHNINMGYYEQFARQPGPELLIAKQNALAAHTQLWQNTMRRPFFYSENVHATGSQLLHRYEDLTRILQ